jgi:hypothetical protein
LQDVTKPYQKNSDDLFMQLLLQPGPTRRDIDVLLLGQDDEWTLDRVKASVVTLRFWQVFNTRSTTPCDVQVMLAR